jgi:hypothetical protein
MENYNIIETVAASAGDIVLTGNGQLKMTGAPVFPLKSSRLGDRVAAAAAVAQVSTVTVTAAANTRYAFVVTQKIGDDVMVRTISVRTGATAGAAVDISNQFEKQLESNGLKMTATTALGVTTITAAAGFEVFSIANVSNTAVATTTPGSYAVGLGSVLNASGLSGFVAANYYDAYPVEIGSDVVLNGGIEQGTALTDYTVFVNIGTNAASPSATSALVAVGYSNVARGFNVNAGVAVATQAATATAIAAATTVAGLVAAVAPLGLIGVNSYNQKTSG